MGIKTEQELKDEMTLYIDSNLDYANTSEGTLLQDCIISAQANQISSLYTTVANVQVSQGVSNPSAVADEKMDALAYDWGLTRKGSVYAQGYVTFTSYNKPSDTIAIGNSDGSGGLGLATRQRYDGTVVSFTTLETVYLTPSTAIDSNGFYSVTAQIKCNESGTIGNVSANAITIMSSPVRGIDTVTNTIATTGGQDKESNVALGTRIQAKVKGLHRGTSNGFRTLGLSIPGIIDVQPVGPNDLGVVRNIYGGGVDVYVLGENPTAYAEEILYTTGTTSYALTKKPVSEITKVSAIVGATYMDLALTSDYTFLQDTTSEEAYSTKSLDSILFTATGSSKLPNTGTNFTVAYLYDSNIVTLQESLDADNSSFVTADNLAKKSMQVLVNVGLTVTKYSSSSTEQTRNDAITVVTTYFNNLLLGQTAEQSDIVSLLKDLSSIDNVAAPFTYMYKRGETPASTNLTVYKLEYLRVDNTSITVDVV